MIPQPRCPKELPLFHLAIVDVIPMFLEVVHFAGDDFPGFL